MTCRASAATCGVPMLASGASAMPTGLFPGFLPRAIVWRSLAIVAPVSDSCRRQAGDLSGDFGGHRPALSRPEYSSSCVCAAARPASLRLEKRSYVDFFDLLVGEKNDTRQASGSVCDFAQVSSFRFPRGNYAKAMHGPAVKLTSARRNQTRISGSFVNLPIYSESSAPLVARSRRSARSHAIPLETGHDPGQGLVETPVGRSSRSGDIRT